jgi:hypothetical protein
MTAEEFTNWEERKKEQTEGFTDELAEIARKSPTAKGFGRTLVACLEWELQREMRMFLVNEEHKKSFMAFKKAIEVAQRLVNKAITEE